MSTVLKSQPDPALLRRAFGAFATGVTIVTTKDEEGRPRGLTANSFTSVSLDPPLVLICISRSAASFDAFATAAGFAVNILHEGQVALSALFASKASHKFQSVDHVRLFTGAPVLQDSLAWFDCSVHSRVDAGDHIVLIGRVEAFEARTAPPLGFSCGRYASVREMRPVGGPPCMTSSSAICWKRRIRCCCDQLGRIAGACPPPSTGEPTARWCWKMAKPSPWPPTASFSTLYSKRRPGRGTSSIGPGWRSKARFPLAFRPSPWSVCHMSGWRARPYGRSCSASSVSAVPAVSASMSIPTTGGAWR